MYIYFNRIVDLCEIQILAGFNIIIYILNSFDYFILLVAIKKNNYNKIYIKHNIHLRYYQNIFIY